MDLISDCQAVVGLTVDSANTFCCDFGLNFAAVFTPTSAGAADHHFPAGSVVVFLPGVAEISSMWQAFPGCVVVVVPYE